MRVSIKQQRREGGNHSSYKPQEPKSTSTASGNCVQNKRPESERARERDGKVRIVSYRTKGLPLVHRTTGSVWTNQAQQPQRRETSPGFRVSPALGDRLEDLCAFLRHLNQHQRSLRCLESHQTVDNRNTRHSKRDKRGMSSLRGGIVSPNKMGSPEMT